MRLSFNILFLGWLSRETWASVGQSYPKPSISVSPSDMVTLGENATIQCESELYPEAEFHLLKQTVLSPHTRAIQTARKHRAVFQISNAKILDGAIYWCIYCVKALCDEQSPPSDRITLNVIDPSLSKPSITVRSSNQLASGLTATIECRGRQQNLKFALFKSGDLTALQSTEPATDMVEFPVSVARLEGTGSYTCQYHHKRYPFIWSEPSDPVELVVAAPTYPRPSISVTPRVVVVLGGQVSIRCQSGLYQEAKYYLYKEGTSSSQPWKVKSGLKEAAFPIVNAKRSDGSIYWCQYCTEASLFQECSGVSDRVGINITDPSLSKPSITMRPKEELSLGLNATIECQGPESGLYLSLFTSKDSTASWLTKSAANTTEFLFSSVSLEEAGRYTCRYHRTGSPFVWSEPSDPVELVVRDHTSPVTNIRLAAAVFVLLALVLIVAEAMYSWKRGQLKEP